MATMNIDVSRRFSQWAKTEVWTGPTGTGQYVPNPGDIIFDVPGNAAYKVVNVDYTTGLSQWERFVFTALNGATDTDVLIGVGPGADSETWRLHASMRTIPFEARMDLRLVIPGAEASFIKVFSTTDYSDPGSVISAMYDSNDQWVSDNVPVVGTGQYKSVGQFYLKESVETGQPLYVKVYNAAGMAISEYRFLAHVTDYIPSGNISLSHITNITLETKFSSETVTDLVQIPKNMPLSSLVLHAKVHYSDGRSGIWPIDGTKFTLLNIQSFVAGIEGQIIPVRLKYTLFNTESGDGVFNNGSERFLTRLYNFEVMPTDYSYSVKLMSFLDWDAVNSKYNMVSYLYSLDRDEAFNVSSMVVFGVTGDSFTGVPGSGLRDHIVTMDLEDLNPSYEDFRYIQTTPTEILSSGISSGSRWEISNAPGGDTYTAITANVSDVGANYSIDLDGGFTTLTDWLEATYEIHGPLLAPGEIEPPVPTHFRIIFGAVTLQVPIDDWNNDILFSKNGVMTTGRLLMIEFVKVDGSTTQVLGGCGFTITMM